MGPGGAQDARVAWGRMDADCWPAARILAKQTRPAWGCTGRTQKQAGKHPSAFLPWSTDGKAAFGDGVAGELDQALDVWLLHPAQAMDQQITFVGSDLPAILID